MSNDDLKLVFERAFDATYRAFLLEHRRRSVVPLNERDAALAKIAVAFGFSEGFNHAARLAEECEGAGRD